MASKKYIESTGNWQFTIKRAGLLPKPIYLTFDNEQEGIAFCARVEALLDKGIIPPEYETKTRVLTLAGLVREYEKNAHPGPKDRAALGTLMERLGKTPLSALTSSWVDAWIAEMKRVGKLAPATIRTKIGAVARCTDWGVRKHYLTMPDHPFRSLPNGYSQYSELDIALAGVARVTTRRCVT